MSVGKTMDNDSSWLDQLYEPRSVAVVGASDDIKLPGGRLLQFMLNYGFAGPIYPVNPNRATVQGRVAYKSLLDLPERVDIAILLVAAVAAVDALEQCAQLGIPVVMIGSSGFAEIGAEGAALQARLIDIARRGGIRVIGPNTNGIINTRNGFAATFSPILDQQGFTLRDGPIAIVSQSGAIGGALYYDGQRSGLPVGRLYNSGNEIDITLEMVIDALLDDRHGPDQPGSISTILCYVEGLRRPDLFVAAARKAQRLGKRIVMLKAGVTPAGAKAAAAHTASLSGEDRVYDGVLRELGVVRATGLTHMLDVGRVFAAYPQALGKRASIVSMSGGIGIMLTDALERAGLGLAAFSEHVLGEIDPLLPAFLGRHNPLDVSGGPFHYLDRLRALMQIFERNPESDFTIVAVGAFERRQMEIAEVIADEAKKVGKPVLVHWFGGGDQAIHFLNSNGVPAFPDAERLVAAIAPGATLRPTLAVGSHVGSSVGSSAATNATSSPAAAALPVDDFVPDAAAARAVIAAARHAGRSVIDEVDGKKILAAYGIDVVAERVVASAADCSAALTALRLPVVAKLRSDELVHKARVGGVRLGLHDVASVTAAVDDLLALAQRLGLRQADVVLQEQVPAGVELLLGAKHDMTFGPVVTLGIGGVLTEAWHDVQIRLADGALDVADMLGRLQHQSLLDGSGGRPAVSAATIAVTLTRFARLVRALGTEVEAIDVNPVIVVDGARAPVAVDTVFFLAPTGQA